MEWILVALQKGILARLKLYFPSVISMIADINSYIKYRSLDKKKKINEKFWT